MAYTAIHLQPSIHGEALWNPYHFIIVSYPTENLKRVHEADFKDDIAALKKDIFRPTSTSIRSLSFLFSNEKAFYVLKDDSPHPSFM